jgi:RIO kinase 1
MTEPLDLLLADGVIDEVVARLKGGKEADVWLVRHEDRVVAAKVYRARASRSFKNDAAYKDGRQVRNTRTQRAMDRGSRFGKAAAEDAWKSKEADALYKLHAAGLRVPRPVLFYEGVLLMDLVLDAHGRPAPRLVEAPLGPEQAAELYAVVRSQVVGMLAQDLIHGDLSPFNVLLGADGPVVIDFPQVVGAAHNSQAEMFFLRDLHNIHQFLVGLDPALRAAQGDGREIWRAYVRRELTADFVPTGRTVEPPQPAGRPHPRPSHEGGAAAKRPGSRPPAARPHGEHAGGSHPRAATGSQGGHPREPQRSEGGGRSPQGAGGGRPREPQRPEGGGRSPQGAAGGRRGRDPRRGGSMPEVIRVERPARGAPGPGGRAPEGSRTPGQGSASASGATGGNRPGSHPHAGGRRHWSRRRG